MRANSNFRVLFVIFFLSQAWCFPVERSLKKTEASSEALSNAKQSYDATTKPRRAQFGRASRLRISRRYAKQFSKETIEKMSKKLQGKELTDYLERAENFRLKKNSGSLKSKIKAKLRKSNANLAKSLEAEQAAKEKKEQLAAANKAAFSQI